MSRDYIGPFGPESVEAVAIERFSYEMFGWHKDRGRRRGRERWERTAEDIREGWRQEARGYLTAARSALDREALIERAADALREIAYPSLAEPIAAMVIEALFPTEPEAQDGH